MKKILAVLVYAIISSVQLYAQSTKYTAQEILNSVYLDAQGNPPAFNTQYSMQNVLNGVYSDTGALRIKVAAGGADNLGNHVATKTLDMGGFGISNAGSVTASSATITGNAFSVGGSTLVVSGGKVGIGTTAPGAKLEILQTDTAQAYSVKIGTSATAYHVVVSTTGNVGIGTTGPGAKLDILGTSGTALKISSTFGRGIDSQIMGTGAENYGVLAAAVGAGTTNYGLYGDAANAGTNWAGYFDRGNVYIAGNVGIGTTWPVTKLQVGVGNTSADTAIAKFNTTDTDVAALELSNWDGAAASFGPRIHFDNSGVGNWYIGSASGVNAFDIATVWGTPLVRISNSGATTGGALCLNASKVLSKCTSAVDASGNCTCP